MDTSGTLFGLVSNMGCIDENGDFPRSRMAYSCDGLGTLVGSFFGLSPITSYIESAAGVGTGSRTGLTAVLCGFFFFLSIFFAPIIASIPAWATGGALVVVGSMMAKALKDIKWHDPTHAATAFLTVIIMPLTYSIAYGLIAGIGTYLVLNTTFYLLTFLGIEKPVFTPEDIDQPISLEAQPKELEVTENEEGAKKVEKESSDEEAPEKEVVEDA